MKKIAIIGAGTAGSYSIGHFLHKTDWDIDWYFDPTIKPQAVGEGSTLHFPFTLYQQFGFDYRSLKEVKGTHKVGIRKINWGKFNRDFTHIFPPGSVGYHFNANELQAWIYDSVKSNSRIKVINEKVVNHDDIDSNYIMDCSGKPSDYTEYHMSDTIPVNSVYVTQCFWDNPTFNYTLAQAMKHGWVFGIPLLNRCSIGYMYNNNISSLEEVKEDVKFIFKEHELTPSDITNSFSFKNYYRKLNFKDRVAYNGNASFFLEPLEATSIATMHYIHKLSVAYWNKEFPHNVINHNYNIFLKQISNMIMLHYAAGSIFDSAFWRFAQPLGQAHLEEMYNDRRWKEIYTKYNTGDFAGPEYGIWTATNFDLNFRGLGINPDLV